MWNLSALSTEILGDFCQANAILDVPPCDNFYQWWLQAAGPVRAGQKRVSQQLGRPGQTVVRTVLGPRCKKMRSSHVFSLVTNVRPLMHWQNCHDFVTRSQNAVGSICWQFTLRWGWNPHGWRGVGRREGWHRCQLDRAHCSLISILNKIYLSYLIIVSFCK